MRTKSEYTNVLVTKELHKRLLKERQHFEKIIGGGKWSIADTIWEFIKIAEMNKK